MNNATYDKIANEYYDQRHVTSRNFDHTTLAALNDYTFDITEELVLEIGAGRGRCTEFLGVDSNRIVQLDNSEAMLALANREECLLQIHGDACDIPLISKQFGNVVGFLVDPFLGLNCISEAYRMLKEGGKLLFTVPTQLWGTGLRKRIGIDLMTTRFKLIDSEEEIIMPSLLHSKDRLRAMFQLIGFSEIEIDDHCLPQNESPVSQDIINAGVEDYMNLPLIHTIRAQR